MGTFGMAVVVAVAVGMAARSAAGQEATDLLFADWKAGQFVQARSDGYFEGKPNLDDGSSTRLSLVRSSMKARLSDSDEINPTLGVNSTHFELGDTALLPRQLDDVSASFATPLAGEKNWFVGASAGAGYAGDRAFGDGNALYGLGAVMYGRTFENGDQLVLMVDYDGNRALLPDVQIPSVEFHASPVEGFAYTLGFPYADVKFEPLKEWRIEVSYSFPQNVAMEIGYRPVKAVEFFGRLASTEDAFHVEEMPSDRRLFFEESRVEVGADWEISDWISVTAGVGYAFERSFSTGFDDRNLTHVTSVEDSVYGHVGVEVRF